MGVRCFRRLVPWDSDRRVSLGLIHIADSASVPATIAKLRARLGKVSPHDRMAPIQVLSRAEVMQWERNRWLRQTPIGMIFQLGVALSLLVGAAIVYMVLATDVMDRLPEYATLLAMGYSRLYLASVVMTQAMVLACLGFVAAWFVAEMFYRLTSSVSGIPIMMNGARVILVAILGLVMCCVSGLLAMNKLWKAEPASLF
jgi:putative ABC transport system permease protein